MLKLYGAVRSRSAIVQWFLAEYQIPYELVMLDLQAGEHRQPSYLAVNPIGKLPAIDDEGFILWESGAILLYLAEKHGHLPTSLPERAIATQWVLYANATLGPALFIEANREREIPKQLPAIDAILAQHPFLLGDNFSVVDVAVGSMLIYGVTLLKLDFSAYPAIVDYVTRLSERQRRSLQG